MNRGGGNETQAGTSPVIVFFAMAALCPEAHADIYRWDTGEMIPGTEGITPGTDVELHHRNLEYAKLGGYDTSDGRKILSVADFEESNSAWAAFGGSILTAANLTGANLSGAYLRNAYLGNVFGFQSASLNSSTRYNQWTVFPFDFDPDDAGLTFEPSPAGDFDANDLLDVVDVDLLVGRVHTPSRYPGEPGWWLPDSAFDLDMDLTVDQQDLRIWVRDLKHTWFGDANLDGEFDTGGPRIGLGGRQVRGRPHSRCLGAIHSGSGELVRRRLERRRRVQYRGFGESTGGWWV